MKNIKSLPQDLVDRYQTWRAGVFEQKSTHYSDLANHGQNPQFMIISCCDSRVHVTEIFGADTGDIFAHRNVANLVPPYKPNSDHHGTSAAVEYGVRALKVRNLIVFGHSQCGGVAACHNICTHGVADEQREYEFVGPWLEILKPAYSRINENADHEAQLVDLGQQGIVGSLQNLLGFPFIASAVADGSLTLHGAWHDISSGTLYHYDPNVEKFIAVE